MNRDIDVVRKLLLEIEARAEGIHAALQDIEIDGVSKDSIDYHLDLMIKAGFLRGEVNTFMRGGSTHIIHGIMWPGHDFIDAVRDADTWKKTKEGALSAGGWTLDVLRDLAKGLIRKKIEESTGVKL